MARRNSFFKELLKNLQRIILRVGSFTLIILLSFQIIVRNPQFRESIIGDTVQDYIISFIEVEPDTEINDEQLQQQEPEVQQVFSSGNNLEIELQNLEYAGELNLELNDKVITDFSKNNISLEVRDDDKLVLDTRGIEAGVWFKINDEFLWLQNERREITDLY